MVELSQVLITSSETDVRFVTVSDETGGVGKIPADVRTIFNLQFNRTFVQYLTFSKDVITNLSTLSVVLVS